jgi:hypothetical protein
VIWPACHIAIMPFDNCANWPRLPLVMVHQCHPALLHKLEMAHAPCGIGPPLPYGSIALLKYGVALEPAPDFGDFGAGLARGFAFLHC